MNGGPRYCDVVLRLRRAFWYYTTLLNGVPHMESTVPKSRRFEWYDLALLTVSLALIVYICIRFGPGAFLMHWKYEGAP